MVLSKLFGTDKTPVAGLDISPDFITLVKIIKEDNALKLEHLVRVPTPDGAISGGIMVSPEDIGHAVKEMLSSNGIESVRINVAVPSNIPFLKTVTLPDLPFNELRIIAEDEASNHIPFPVSEANMDYVILENTKRVEEGTKRLVDVLIVAIQKGIAQKIVNMADAAKVRLNSIEVETYSMIKCLANAGQIEENDDINVSVLIGYDSTDITLVSNGMPLFSHMAPIGKKNIIETISTGLALDLKSSLNFIPEVAILVPGYASSNDPNIVKAATLVRMIYNNISTEISKAIQFYRTQKPQTQISKIYLGGCGMCIKNADKFISNRLKIDSILADSFKNIEVSSKLVENYDVPTLVTAVGLALKGIKN